MTSPFVHVATEVVAAAAADLAAIGSTIVDAHAAAATSTTVMLTAAGDEVSIAVAALLGGYAQEFHAVSAWATVSYGQFVETLSVAAQAYAGAEVRNAASLQQPPNAINAVTQALLGRRLIGDGAAGAPGTGADGGPGGLLYGNGGAGGSGAPAPGCVPNTPGVRATNHRDCNPTVKFH
ncbi:hypothetical protein BST40_26755, partial [Mycobacterium persicum]